MEKTMNQNTAAQVGSCFVDQYYKTFNEKRESVQKFYSEESSVLILDGKINRSASKIAQIHELITSSAFTGVEIKTTNSLESLNGGVLVVVSGSVKSREFGASREFVQTFFLAPQEKGGYFVLNDVFLFANEEVEQPFSSPDVTEQDADSESATSIDLPETPVSGNAFEEKGLECVSLAHVARDESVEEFLLLEPIQDQHTWTNEQELELSAEESAGQTGKPKHEDAQEFEPCAEASAEQSEKRTYATMQEPQAFVEEPDEQPEEQKTEDSINSTLQEPQIFVEEPDEQPEEQKTEDSTNSTVQEPQASVEELDQSEEQKTGNSTNSTVQEPQAFVEEPDEQPEEQKTGNSTNSTVQEPQAFVEDPDEQPEEQKTENSTNSTVQELQPSVEEVSELLEKPAFPTLQELYAVAKETTEQPEKLNHATVQELQSSSEETVVPVPTYSSILRVEGKSRISTRIVSRPFLKESNPTLPKFHLDAKEQRPGKSNSVYVKNLPSGITTLDVLYELRTFGKINPDGVFVRNYQGSGASSAFVDFEDAQGAVNAIKASPIQMRGRRVYIEERRSNFGASRDGRRLEEHVSRSSVRNNMQNGGIRINGFHNQ